MKENEKGKIAYQIARMELTQFSLSDSSKDLNQQEINLTINTRVNFAFSEESSALRCKLSVDFSQNKALLLQTELLMFFRIKDESVEALKDGSSLKIPRHVLCQFASFCYGALRGIIYLKTINTPLENVCLPPLEMKKLITGDTVFNLEK